MFSEVSPNSSAWNVANTTHWTMSNHSSSPSRTAGPSGSLDIASSRIFTGPPS